MSELLQAKRTIQGDGGLQPGIPSTINALRYMRVRKQHGKYGRARSLHAPPAGVVGPASALDVAELGHDLAVHGSGVLLHCGALGLKPQPRLPLPIGAHP